MLICQGRRTVIHPTAEKDHCANFALTGFYDVRIGPGGQPMSVSGSKGFRGSINPVFLRLLLKRHLQDAHGLIIVSRQGVFPAAIGSPSPLLELGGVGVVGKVQPVDHPPQVRVIQPHAFQGSV
jgi:hypothetical protein